MAGGFLMGLGQGMQNFAQGLTAYGQREDQMKREAMARALQMEQMDQQRKQFEQQLALQQQQQNRGLGQFLVQNLPANTPLSPDTRGMLDKNGFGAFVRPDMAASSPEALAASTQSGLTPKGPQPPVGAVGPLSIEAPPLQSPTDTGRGYSIPTEDSKMRTAMLNQQASLNRVQYIYQQKAAIQQEMLKARTMWEQAKNDIDRQGIGVQLQRLQLAAQQLDNLIAQQEFENNWKTGVVLPDMLQDNYTNLYRAQHGGATPSMPITPGMLRGTEPMPTQAPARPAPAPPAGPTAPPAKRPPAAKKPPVKTGVKK